MEYLGGLGPKRVKNSTTPVAIQSVENALKTRAKPQKKAAPVATPLPTHVATGVATPLPTPVATHVATPFRKKYLLNFATLPPP